MNRIDQILDDEDNLYVGVIGYSSLQFNEDNAKMFLRGALRNVADNWLSEDGYKNIIVVSGHTNLGMPKVAYEVANELRYRTIGLTANEGKDYDFSIVDEIIWSGEKFGDESEDFIDIIDVLIKIGGGPQSEKEFDMAKKDGVPVMEFDVT